MELEDSLLNGRKWLIEFLYWAVGIFYMLFFLDGELIKMIFNIGKEQDFLNIDVIFKITKNLVILMLITKRFLWKFLTLLNYDNEEKKYGIKGEKFALTLKKINMDLKCFRHDLNNMLHAMSGYMFIGDIGGLNAYFKKLMIDVTRVNFLEQITIKLKNNPAILGILIAKYDKTINKDIEFNIDIPYSVKYSGSKTYIIARIFGILIDNAIEATEMCEEKVINIQFSKDETIGKEYIIISNTFKNKMIDLSRLYNTNYTTKEDRTNHGLGLWKVNELIKESEEYSIYTSIEDGYFVQKFEWCS